MTVSAAPGPGAGVPEADPGDDVAAPRRVRADAASG